MLVDDDSVNRQVMAGLLRDKGWRIREASNGREALRLLQDDLPDLILLDLIMPEMDGFAFLSEVRQSPVLCKLPVVVLTSKDLTESERHLLNINVDRIMQKDVYNLSELFSEVSRRLSVHSSSISP